MFANIHLSKRAHITDAHHLDGEVAVEVNDLECFVSDAEAEDHGSDDRTEEFLE